jgi:type IV pilus assembly protein PilV
MTMIAPDAPHAGHRARRANPSRRAAAGVGLIEILVAVTILAFGLLGIAAMQAATLRNSQSASERSEAVIATYAMLERMRANYAVASNGGYDLAAMTCNAPTASNLVTNDQREWILSLKERLGDSEKTCGQIIDCGGLTCKIIVQWDDSRGTGGNETQQLVTETRL